MEKVLAVFSEKINALLKKIPADEFQIRQELDLLSAYWKEVVIKRIEEMRAALEETLKIRDEEFGKLNNHLLLHEQEFKEELSRRLAEERALQEYKLELKEKEFGLHESNTSQPEPIWKTEYQVKKEEVKYLEAKIRDLEKRLFKEENNFRTGLQILEKENKELKSQAIRQKEEADAELEARLQAKEDELEKLRKDKTDLEQKLSIGHLPYKTKIKNLEQEIECLREKMTNEIALQAESKVNTISEENEKLIAHIAKIREEFKTETETRLKEQETIDSKKLMEKESEIQYLKGEKITLENLREKMANEIALQVESKIKAVAEEDEKLIAYIAKIREEFKAETETRLKEQKDIDSKKLIEKESEIQYLKDEKTALEKQLPPECPTCEKRIKSLEEENKSLRNDISRQLEEKVRFLIEMDKNFRDWATQKKARQKTDSGNKLELIEKEKETEKLEDEKWINNLLKKSK